MSGEPYDFPPEGFGKYFDSSKFELEQADPSKTTKMEGGYEFTRPKYLTKPKRTMRLSFKDLTEQDKDLLMSFWDEMQGGTQSFTVRYPLGGTMLVRFEAAPKFNYVGMGETRRWDVDNIVLKEV